MDYRPELMKRLTALWDAGRQGLQKKSPELFNSFRDDAFARFTKLGLPDNKNEVYKYSNLDTFFSFDYRGYYLPSPADYTQAERFKCEVEDLDVWTMVLMNGFYPHAAEGLMMLPGGIWTGSMSSASKQFSSLMKSHYNKYADNDTDALVNLNTALAPDGLFIYAPKGTTAAKPLQIVNLVHSDRDIFVQDRNLIVVEDGAELTLLVCDHSLSPQHFLTNTVTEIYVGHNARFNIIRVQNQHNNAGKITQTFMHQESDSFATSNNITLHGGLVRNSTYHILAGEHAEARSYGLFLSDKSQQTDNYVFVDHIAPNCSSNQLFKGVLDDQATGAFNGRILVRPGAQGTNAYQANNNVLMSTEAKMRTKPQLEIYADDVKCSHGATVGQIDEEALFYLRSRGIDEREARLMLMFGFAHEVIQNIHIEALRDRIDTLVMQRLRGELTRCASCAIKCN